MGVGVIEEIALDAPGFVVDLTPLGAGIDGGLHGPEVQRLAGIVIAGLQIVGRGDGPAALAGVEHLGAVMRNREMVQVAEHDFRMALFQREPPDSANVGLVVFAGRTADRRTLEEVKNPGLARGDFLVIAGRNGKRKNAIADAVEVDGDFDRLVLVVFGGFFVLVGGLVFIR